MIMIVSYAPNLALAVASVFELLFKVTPQFEASLTDDHNVFLIQATNFPLYTNRNINVCCYNAQKVKTSSYCN
jgi:hypothetical protein